MLGLGGFVEIVAIGNALMDVIAFVDEDFAPSLGFHNGSTIHLTPERLAAVLECLSDFFMVAGGGAANTARAAAFLGLDAICYGAVGSDSLGARYEQDLTMAKVDARLVHTESPTGQFCALLRPDGGRTILVAPGAALDLPKHPPIISARDGAFLYLDGFLAMNPAFFVSCLEQGRRAGMRIAIDLGSRSLVASSREFFLESIATYCSYVFANDDEFSALAGSSISEGLDEFGKGKVAFIVKMAERGSFYACGGTICESPVRAIRPLDETGAGDAFAAGFLSGVAKGFSPERCLRLGNRIAEEILAVPGLRVERGRMKVAEGSVGA
jgi:sugar/nucleoside kinase (ribokinase family)